MTTQVDNKARSYTHEVCRRTWALVVLSRHTTFRIGDAEYVSFLVCQRVPIKVVQQEPRVEEEQFLSLECA